MPALLGRHARELQLLAEAAVEGRRMTAEDLRSDLGVSAATIYNDLELLSGLRIERSRGSVQLVSESADRYPPRFSMQSALKRAIASEVLAQIEVGAVAYLDTGSTCFHVARKIVEDGRTDVRLITPNPFALSVCIAAGVPTEIVLLGGTLRREAASLHGPMTQCAVKQFSYDVAIISVDFIHTDPDVTIAAFSDAEVAQKQSAIDRCLRTIVVADSTKLGRSIGHPIASLKSLLKSKPVTVVMGLSVSDDTQSYAAALASIRAQLGEESVLVVKDEVKA